LLIICSDVLILLDSWSANASFFISPDNDFSNAYGSATVRPQEPSSVDIIFFLFSLSSRAFFLSGIFQISFLRLSLHFDF